MATYIRNIVFESPDPPSLGRFYAQLLNMRILREDWFVIGKDQNSYPRLAFDGPAPHRPPRWPDPEHPQQLHLDFPVSDLDGAEEIALRLGAAPLQDKGSYRSYADPDGHPFCLYLDPESEPGTNGPISGRIGRIVYDCFSPRALASFYEGLLGMPVRREDSELRVVIGHDDPTLPSLAFQHAQSPAPRWPDPNYPQQIHPDIEVTDGRAAEELALRLGAIHLPAMGGSCPVYADPAAHPFCLCSPHQ